VVPRGGRERSRDPRRPDERLALAANDLEHDDRNRMLTGGCCKADAAVAKN
jgi:hypothetical protein